jgi:hypothetical protein
VADPARPTLAHPAGVRSGGTGPAPVAPLSTPGGLGSCLAGPAAGRGGNTAAFGWGSRHRIPAGRDERKSSLAGVSWTLPQATASRRRHKGIQRPPRRPSRLLVAHSSTHLSHPSQPPLVVRTRVKRTIYRTSTGPEQAHPRRAAQRGSGLEEGSMSRKTLNTIATLAAVRRVVPE